MLTQGRTFQTSGGLGGGQAAHTEACHSCAPGFAHLSSPDPAFDAQQLGQHPLLKPQSTMGYQASSCLGLTASCWAPPVTQCPTRAEKRKPRTAEAPGVGALRGQASMHRSSSHTDTLSPPPARTRHKSHLPSRTATGPEHWPGEEGVPSSLSLPVAGAHRVDGVDQLPGLAELHEALPQVVQGSLHQHLLLLVVVQQVVP